jgi:hypothetical protein
MPRCFKGRHKDPGSKRLCHDDDYGYQRMARAVEDIVVTFAQDQHGHIHMVSGYAFFDGQIWVRCEPEGNGKRSYYRASKDLHVVQESELYGLTASYKA